MKKVTMQDIADRLGLTKVSVSKALNGQPDISAETRARIIETAIEMGYQIKQHEAKKTQAKNFAMIVPKRFFLETDGFYTELFYYLNRFCMQDGHQLYSIVLNAKEESELVLPDKLRETLFDGVFLMGELHEDYLRMLAAHSLNMVAIDFYRKGLRSDYVLTDNYYLGYSAAQYLLDKGHTRIGFVGDVYQTNSIMDRYLGYVKALMLAGIQPRTDWHLVNNDELGVYRVDVALPRELPTAFVCHCDMAGQYMIQTLRSRGLRVPDEVSLICFDNTHLSERTVPPLTTYHIDRKEFAERAYRCMLDQCKEARAEEKRIFISGSLIERESVGDVRGR